MKYEAEVAAAVAHWGPPRGLSIDPALVHAIIQRESSHGAKLQTAEPGGHTSYGPMMVLDTTAHAYGLADASILLDPARGIDYGVRTLSDLMLHFRGDTAAAVSAYNTGPARAVRNKAAGKFPNQPYVDAVYGWWRLYGGAAGGAGALLAIVVGLWLWLRYRKR